MDANFVWAVRNMRQAQKNFFSSKREVDLREAKELEKMVDKMLRENERETAGLPK